jgi:hypothetical protein
MTTPPENVRVEYSIETTINLGNFQNVKPGYRLSADIPEGSNASTVRSQLKALADRWLAEDIEEHQKDARA